MSQHDLGDNFREWLTERLRSLAGKHHSQEQHARAEPDLLAANSSSVQEEVSTDDVDSGDTDRSGPPAHWLRDIEERAPHLLESFGGARTRTTEPQTEKTDAVLDNDDIHPDDDEVSSTNDEVPSKNTTESTQADDRSSGPVTPVEISDADSPVKATGAIAEPLEDESVLQQIDEDGASPRRRRDHVQADKSLLSNSSESERSRDNHEPVYRSFEPGDGSIAGDDHAALTSDELSDSRSHSLIPASTEGKPARRNSELNESAHSESNDPAAGEDQADNITRLRIVDAPAELENPESSRSTIAAQSAEPASFSELNQSVASATVESAPKKIPVNRDSQVSQLPRDTESGEPRDDSTLQQHSSSPAVVGTTRPTHMTPAVTIQAEPQSASPASQTPIASLPMSSAVAIPTTASKDAFVARTTTDPAPVPSPILYAEKRNEVKSETLPAPDELPASSSSQTPHIEVSDRSQDERIDETLTCEFPGEPAHLQQWRRFIAAPDQQPVPGGQLSQKYSVTAAKNNSRRDHQSSELDLNSDVHAANQNHPVSSTAFVISAENSTGDPWPELQEQISFDWHDGLAIDHMDTARRRKLDLEQMGMPWNE